MPSPFPGMDPFIESQKWEDFHLAAILVIRELLAPQVADKYVVNVQERVYLQESSDDEPVVVPDVAVDEAAVSAVLIPSSGASTATAIAPVECLLPKSEPRREGYLEVRTSKGDRLVTVIEFLSPDNKRAGLTGSKKYLAKRRRYLDTSVNLVEVDLLRGGRRLPMHSPLPAGHYFAIISRGRTRPKSSVYAWRLPDRLPAIPVPLSPNDDEPMLDLQSVLDLVYDRAIYRLSMRYDQPLVPPATPELADWVQSILAARS